MIAIQDTDLTVYNGDVREMLPLIPDESVDCCLTSPPFWSLRDYQVEGQMGLEETVEEHIDNLVGVFREVRRTLRPHGTLWIEYGDMYTNNTSLGNPTETSKGGTSTRPTGWASTWADGKVVQRPHPYKRKDLVLAPFQLALALRGPWYIGKIKSDVDRVWLAAMVDAEGCIHIHRRKAGTPSHSKFTRKDGTTVNYERKNDTFGVMVSVSNTNRAIVENCRRIYDNRGSISTHEAGIGAQQRKQSLHQWTVTGTQARDLIRELYPHLIAKQQQARIAMACPSSNGANHQEAIKLLHNGGSTTLDGPKPSGLWEPGYYMRQVIIWRKLNPMPESTTDRCTAAHSYILLLSKKPYYYFDHIAIQEEAAWERWGSQTTPKYNGTDTKTGWIEEKSKEELSERTTRNARSVWSIPTGGYPDAHFATFPNSLVERVLKGGCPLEVCATCHTPRERVMSDSEGLAYTNLDKDRKYADTGRPDGAERRNPRGGQKEWETYKPAEQTGWTDCGHNNYQPGVVLDPFLGSGTTAVVARKMGLKTIGIELNPEYLQMIRRRTQQLSLLG